MPASLRKIELPSRLKSFRIAAATCVVFVAFASQAFAQQNKNGAGFRVAGTRPPDRPSVIG